MVRQLVAFSSLLLLLVGVSLACSAPSGDVAPGSPAAQATDVRRTAVAQVQRIISNPSTPTPQPQPTSTPAPTCPNALWWTEARGHVGETRTIQGTVVAARPAPGGLTLLELGQLYPDPTGVAVLVSAPAAADLNGKTVCASGRIEIAEGRPTLRLQGAAAITVVS